MTTGSRACLRSMALGLLVATTWAIAVYHRGVFPPPRVVEPTVARDGVFLPRATAGINQLVLEGSPYERGLAAGRLTAPLLREQERALREKFEAFIPFGLARRAFILGIIRFFWGIEPFFEPWATEEMYGVSKSAPREFDDLMDGFTRQIGYHGLHEVGQFFVDQGNLDMGCTVFLVPSRGSWVIGRNFDFEGGRIFDEEKIVKWVFPDRGNAFVSVIWAGMVGLVTAVNEKGVYLSINAAGSNEYRRYGTPSTLVALKAIQFASTAEEAARVIEGEKTLITDIFVVSDGKRAFRIEKSPKHTRTSEVRGPAAVTNHLLDAGWGEDKVNEYRKRELTTIERYERASALIATIDPAREIVPQVLGFLRDRHDATGKPLDVGNRKAIDGLIATHSVIYDGRAKRLYVSRGPAVSGAFLGYDLERSFRSHRPVEVEGLPADAALDPKAFWTIKQALEDARHAAKLARKKRCAEAGAALDRIPVAHREHAAYYAALGDYEACRKESDRARSAWKAALGLSPAYPQEKRELERKLHP